MTEEEIIAHLLKTITLDPQDMAKYRSKFYSYEDNRPSAIALGSTGSAIILGIISLIVLMDANNLHKMFQGKPVFKRVSGNKNKYQGGKEKSNDNDANNDPDNDGDDANIDEPDDHSEPVSPAGSPASPRKSADITNPNSPPNQPDGSPPDYDRPQAPSPNKQAASSLANPTGPPPFAPPEVPDRPDNPLTKNKKIRPPRKVHPRKKSKSD